jgi:ubiquitin carboxyl-terminal hydrolase 2/21
METIEKTIEMKKNGKTSSTIHTSYDIHKEMSEIASVTPGTIPEPVAYNSDVHALCGSSLEEIETELEMTTANDIESENDSGKNHEPSLDKDNNVIPMEKYNEEFGGKGLTGLANMGNTCFLNATLQCISHTYELNHFLNNKKYKEKVNKKPESLILVEWDKLRELMWSENCVISPGGFVGSVQKIAKIKDKDIFTGYAQNDLPEFLLFIIDCFHESLNRGVTMKISGTAEDDRDNLAIKCYKMLENMYQNDYSEIIQMFYGISVTQICDDTNIIRQNPEPFFLLNLPLPEGKRECSIYDCFDLFTANERMEGDNKWYNDEAKEHQEVDKNTMFFNLPDLLVVDLKRFNNMIRKNNMLVDIPLDGIDLSKYVIGYNKYNNVYDLYGVCNHSGSTMGGHYTAYVKNANGKWYHFNDTSITEVSDSSTVITPKAYCLFFRRRQD